MQGPAADRLMYRHKFDCRDPERAQVFDRGAGPQARIGAPLLPGNFWMAPGESFEMKLIDDGFVPGNAQRTVGTPIEGGINHYALGDQGHVIPLIFAEVLILIPDLIAE